MTTEFNQPIKEKTVKIGVIGVGRMGLNAAKLLVRAKHKVYVYDLDHGRVKQATELGCRPAENPKNIAENAEISLLSLPMPKDVDSVVCGPEGILSGSKKGHIIVDLSTVDPFSTRKNAKKAQKHGVGYLDAPVLGLPQNCGKWTLPVGGEKEDLEKVRNALEVIAVKVIHVGPSGNGNILKLLNNMMFGTINMIAVEILALCSKLGMDPALFYETIAGSGAASVSNLFVEIGPMILDRDFEPFFSIELLHKDNELGIQMAKKAGVPLFVAPAAHTLTEVAKSKGLGKEGVQAAVKIYEDIFKIRVESGR
jgi:3-hydroxyisobutyrate dehydrogenase-like beta-hydroxyacid dehydrogenase